MKIFYVILFVVNSAMIMRKAIPRYLLVDLDKGHHISKMGAGINNVLDFKDVIKALRRFLTTIVIILSSTHGSQ